MASTDDVLLHKAAQGKPLRGSLAPRFKDLKALEFELRKRLLVPGSQSTSSLLGDHYVRLQGGVATDSGIPLKHSRKASESSTYATRRKSSSRRRPESGKLPSRPTTAALESREVVSARGSATHSSSRATLGRTFTTFTFPSGGGKTERSIARFEARCSTASRGIKRAQRSVKRLRRKCANSFKACAKRLDTALQADIIGFVPTALRQLRQEKNAAKPKSPWHYDVNAEKQQSFNLEKEIVKEYRNSLASKALTHGTDYVHRYVYTLGSILPAK